MLCVWGSQCIFLYMQVCLYLSVCVCVRQSLSSYMKANSRLPSHCLNSRRALILILTVTVLLLWSVAALGGSKQNQKYPLNSLRTQHCTACFVKRHTVERWGDKRQNHRATVQDRDPCCMRLTSNPDRIQRITFISLDFTRALLDLVEFTHKHQCKSCFYTLPTYDINCKSSEVVLSLRRMEYHARILLKQHIPTVYKLSDIISCPGLRWI